MPQPMSAIDALLRAVIDRILPADDDPAASGFGADAYVARRLAEDAALATIIREGLSRLERHVLTGNGGPFAGLPAARQDDVLRRFEDEPWFRALCEWVAEGVYADPDNGGNRGAAAWAMVGYRHGLPEGPSGPAGRDGQPPRPLAEGLAEFDVIIVGAGAGGGIAAGILAEAGKTVLLIERGVERSYADSGHRDHLRNQRLSLYGTNIGPDLEGNPRVVVGPDGTEHVARRPIDAGYHNLAAAVGSGTLVYGMHAWRFHPDDFRMASLYGVPDGSSLTDWPITYDELAPFYEQAEWEIGVAGAAGANRNEGARRRPYPLPPVPTYGAAEVLRRGAEKLGVTTFTPPLALNTVPRDGRGACMQCGSCVGFLCPTDAKNGTHNTMIARAIRTGRCTLTTGAMVLSVDTDDRGKVIGVTLAEASGLPRRVRARAVVLACGAIETARLLLNSRSSREPDGLGNGHDLVGRNLQGHLYPGAMGLFDEDVHGFVGPGVTIATTDWSHGNDGVIGGGMLADDFIMPPVIFWRGALPPDLPRWGAAAKDFMRRHYRHVLKVLGPVHEIPSAESRVTVSATVRDRWGLSVPRLSGTVHAESLRTARFMSGRAEAWLTAAGAGRVWAWAPGPGLSAGQHQAGTCRMGTEPAHSVTDAYGRVWGHDNLFVSDGSLHPTNGGYNPVLTIMALAFRNAAHISQSI